LRCNEHVCFTPERKYQAVGKSAAGLVAGTIAAARFRRRCWRHRARAALLAIALRSLSLSFKVRRAFINLENSWPLGKRHRLRLFVSSIVWEAYWPPFSRGGQFFDTAVDRIRQRNFNAFGHCPYSDICRKNMGSAGQSNALAAHPLGFVV